ncbi:restriction endonuclease [Flavobacterium aquidurense]|uniref:restriction endonuclease n=1 Tax=Flavobacterium aquidurense TaxID=362413 RepID=UPI0037567593
MIIDFAEIPLANTGIGDQDTFELFARDFLEELGYEIISNPARGADNGKDLIVRELREGISGQKTIIDWLVSCKHYSHSGRSITPAVEQNIYDRVHANNCNGFIGFYSTIPSEGLVAILDKMPYQIFDKEKIEKQIVGIDKFEKIFQRFFPQSFKKWKSLNQSYAPIKLFDYYILNAHKSTLTIFKNAFKTNEAMFVARQKSETVDDFLAFRNIKIHKLDIDFEYDQLSKQYYNEIKSMLYTSQKQFLREKILKGIPNIEDTATFDVEGFALRDAGEGRFILIPAALVINDVEYNYLVDEYNSLKSMIEN